MFCNQCLTDHLPDENCDGSTEQSLFGDVIHTYSRAQAIADGVLVDVSEVAREAGLKFPTAITRAAWDDCVAWTRADTNRTGAAQDEQGRLWDVLWMCRVAALSAPPGPIIQYELHRVPRAERYIEGTPPLVRLKAVCGPGDDPAPVITILLPHED
jgi:hypothetical protein